MGAKVNPYPVPDGGLGYSDMFRIRRVETMQLQDEHILAALRSQGYEWIRRFEPRRFERIVRNPTVGCVVEVCVLQHPGCVHMDSPQAKKLIQRVCYF